jgi:hypothetical protein
MRADAGLTIRTSPSSRQDRRGATRHRVLLAVGTAAAAAAAIAYLTAVATHPMAAMLKGFDLRVYLGGARQALSDHGRLYAWTYDGHPGIQFTYTPFAALLIDTGPRLVRARRGDLGDLRRLARLLVRQGRPAPGRPYRLRSRLRLGARRQPGLRRVPLARPATARGQPGAPRGPRPVRRRAGGRLPLAQDHLLAARPAEGNLTVRYHNAVDVWRNMMPLRPAYRPFAWRHPC